jgi:hypothetical protein
MALLQFLYEALMQHTEAYRSALLDPEVAAVTTAHVSLIPNASVVPIERANFLTFLQDVAQGTTP